MPWEDISKFFSADDDLRAIRLHLQRRFVPSG